MNWIKIKKRNPPCSRDKNGLGTPVLIWPRNPQLEQGGVDGHAYYGRRVTGRPTFYKYGAEIHGITHWMPLPEGPEGSDETPISVSSLHR